MYWLAYANEKNTKMKKNIITMSRSSMYCTLPGELHLWLNILTAR